MNTLKPLAAAPTIAGERYGVMDVLRGFALFGVMTINVYEFGGVDVLITAEQYAALPSAALDERVRFCVRLLVADKANTLFACLFGIGFWIQMERLQARGAPFVSIYMRRAAILLVFGWLHLFFLFSWEVLHIYGIAAFILLLCRNLSDRTLIGIGAALLLLGKPVITWIFAASGVSGPLEAITLTEAAILARQSAAQSGDFPAFMGLMADNIRLAWLLNGGLLAWIAYATGRFFVGAWIARKGWIQNAGQSLAPFRAMVWPLLVGGLALESAHLLTENGPDTLKAAGKLLHALATPMIAAGYACGIILLFHGRSLAWLVRPLAPVGQMALTNYVLQSFGVILILTGVGPGLGLAGKAGVSTFLPLVAIFFAGQIVLSHFWLKAFAFGPLEWAWRTLTYGEAPRLRRPSQVPA
ncbi:MAG: DUF418 domain-containing protein [Erythrobacter sp.]|jgi:uncharacterized protein|nr:DUF418 domain-containing protein [Erythrobacter sp.]